MDYLSAPVADLLRQHGINANRQFPAIVAVELKDGRTLKFGQGDFQTGTLFSETGELDGFADTGVKSYSPEVIAAAWVNWIEENS